MNIDKRITFLLRASEFFKKNKNNDNISFSDVDLNESWVKEVERFIDLVFSERKFQRIFKSYQLTREDLIHFFILMTIATMPNPVFKTGHRRIYVTLVGSQMYQEIKRQLIPCLELLDLEESSEYDQEHYEHRYATPIMCYAYNLKGIHDHTYGPVNIDDI